MDGGGRRRKRRGVVGCATASENGGRMNTSGKTGPRSKR